MKFKKGDCVRCGELYGEITDIHESLEKYVIKWYDANPETTNERFKDIDNKFFIKISKDKLIALAL